MSINKKKKVFVGLSGGVDSSVAAYLLKKQGYDVIGAFIKSYNVDGCEEEDAEYARRVADKLGIPFYVFDMREEYFSRVVAEMIDGYRAGLTPNPDVLCNRDIKFGLLWDRAKRLGADYIATGHYARIARSSDALVQSVSGATPKSYSSRGHRTSLYTARDKNKDQSYFLWKLTEEDLKHCLFPIGDYEKPEVRKIAKKIGLPTAEKKDSQGICFLGKVKLPEFLAQYIAPKKGDILDTEGRKVGEHEGVQFYTIGQRHIGAQIKVAPTKVGVPTKVGKREKTIDRKPYYIVSKDAETNTLVVAEGENHPALYRKEVTLRDVSFVDKGFPKSISISGIDRVSVLARVRYRQPLVPAKLVISEIDRVIHKIGISEITMRPLKGKLEFARPVKFVAPGQSAVFYSKNGELLGGGVIIK